MLFFGAGASRDAGVSTVTELVEDFKNILKNQSDPLLLKCVEEILTIIKSWKQETGNDSDVDIEELLDVIEKIEDRNNSPFSYCFIDNKLKLPTYLELEAKHANEKTFLSDMLKRSIAKSIAKREIDVQYLHPLKQFISLSKPLNIFSTTIFVSSDSVLRIP